MNEDYCLQKFTKEDLENFERIEQRVLSYPLVTESMEYLLNEIYRFGSYICERITEGSKKGIKCKPKNNINGTSILNMLDRIEEFSDDLTIKERIFVDRIRRLVDLQMGKLHLYAQFQNLPVINRKVFRSNIENPDEADFISNPELKKIPPRSLKRLAKEACENLINDKKITEVLEETKLNRCVSSLITKELEKIYKLSKANERSISDYFRKLSLQVKKKNGHLIVEDTYIKRI